MNADDTIGYRIRSVHAGAIDEARRVKPSIPLVGQDEFEIHDDFELVTTWVGARGDHKWISGAARVVGGNLPCVY